MALKSEHVTTTQDEGQKPPAETNALLLLTRYTLSSVVSIVITSTEEYV